ncbi:hypothetical protein H0H92_015351 [Tricholoma furcatifolium]|nr:hypothetical protein H0H92_015351 [Tricholoma furcatifolium]
MSVSLNPSSSLGFKRPLTQQSNKRSLIITNHNSQPIAFKVKTTAPKLYCVRPNSGRVEPGESLDVSVPKVMLQALKDEPPINAKCKDKFLIQSTLITVEKETMNLADIWNLNETNEEGRVHQQKLRVTFLPAEGQPLLEEEDEGQPNPYETARQHPVANGHPQPIPDFAQPPPPQPQEDHRSPTPPADFAVAGGDSRDVSHEIPIVHVTSASDAQESPAPPAAQQLGADSDLEYAPEPVPVPIPISAPTPPPVTEPELEPEPTPVPIKEAPVSRSAPVQDPYVSELAVKYEEAQEEITRLRSILANMEEPAVSEIRHRRPALSDDGMSVAETDVQTAYADDHHYRHQQEGVPLQATVVLSGPSNVTGTVTFYQAKGHGPVSVSGDIQNLDPDALRGFHVQFGTDDLGKGGNEESLKTGNAGARAACGVIGVSV